MLEILKTLIHWFATSRDRKFRSTEEMAVNPMCCGGYWCDDLDLLSVPRKMWYDKIRYHHHHNCFTDLFPGPPGWAGARRELLDFMMQGKINRGRHTDHPTGRHSIQISAHLHHPPMIRYDRDYLTWPSDWAPLHPDQCPPPPSPRDKIW